MQIIPLPQFNGLIIEGPDAQTFLQGQVTCDVDALDNHQFTLGACCDHKGRMQANFWLGKLNTSTFLCWLPSSMLTLLHQHLAKYAVFSKVNITSATEYQFFGVVGELADTLPSVFHWPISDNPQRFIAAVAREQTIPTATLDPTQWDAYDIQAGIVYLQPATSGLFTPQMINLQKLGGVSFKKGCYLGQEVVARTQHLGKLKRHLINAHVNSNAKIPVGQELKNTDGTAVGIVVAYSQGNLLAVLQDHALEQSLFVDSLSVELIEI